LPHKTKNTLTINRPLILIGLMGAGKSTVGRRLAKNLHVRFTDSDHEIEMAAACSIADIFEKYGESEFRALEKRVMERLMEDSPLVLATGGGSFMNDAIRTWLLETGTTIWLKAGLDTLVKRTALRGGRPLLETADPRATLEQLINERYPVYAEAHMIIDTDVETLDGTVNKIIEALTQDTERRT